MLTLCVHHSDTPGDNSATICAINLPFNFGEQEPLDLFGSVSNAHNRNSTAVSAVNFPVKPDGDDNLRPSGQRFVMYGNRELAEFAVNHLDRHLGRDRCIEVRISREWLSFLLHLHK